MELLVELEFISGDKKSKEYSGQDEKHVADLLTKFDWINFGDEHINMRNVKSFRVVSKQEKEEHEKQQAEAAAALLGNLKF